METRSLAAAFLSATLAVVSAPATIHAGGGNNLNLLAGPGLKYGIAKVTGGTLIVNLERTKPRIQPPQNDSFLVITDLPAGANVPAPVGGRTFDEAFPNGAYELADLGWGDFRFRDLLAWKGCLQVGGSGGGYDRSRVYCDKTGIDRIKINSGTGNDLVVVDPAITAKITNKCGGRRDPCGALGCLEATPDTCCTPAGLEGCVALPGGSCTSIDPNDPQVLCPGAQFPDAP